MAAKLEWRGATLMLGAFMLADVRHLGPTWWRPRIHTIPLRERAGERIDYKDFAECQKDTESEIRRMLRDAGVDVIVSRPMIHGQLQMGGAPTQEAQHARLDAFLAKQAKPCIGCGASKVEQVEPYVGHRDGCSLVAMWRRHEANL